MLRLLALALCILRGGEPVSVQPDELIEPSPRTIHDVEADLRIAGAVLSYQRSRHTVADNDPDVQRLDVLIDEWTRMHAHRAVTT
jgi:hypothetical protein